MVAIQSPNSPAQTRHPFPLWTVIFLSVLLSLQVALIGVTFKHGIDFNCLENWPASACGGASGTLVMFYCIVGAMFLFAMLRPQPLRWLAAQAGDRLWPLALNGLGFGITVLPVAFMQNSTGTSALPAAFACWGVGMALLLSGAALYIAPAARWMGFVRQNASQLLPVVLVGAFTPFLATLIRPLWQLDSIASLTFNAVVWALNRLGYSPEIYPEHKIIGVDPFYIDIAPVCSGIEGIALVSLFVSLYIYLFRADLKFPRVLLLYPLGILTSALFNILRITILLIIGVEGNPELAVGGFHSHAGWLLFTVIAIGIVVVAQSVPWLQNQAPVKAGTPVPAAPAPFFQDPLVGYILPFAVFMFSALLAQAFSSTPGVVYPLRVLAMVAVLALFWKVYVRLDWRLDPVALGAGALIGIGWVLIPYTPTDTTAAYGALTGLALAGWLVLRGFGTIVLVPVIEELFFRGYLEVKLAPKTGPLVAALITAGLFAVLHNRWAEAFVAGLIFSWVMARRGRVTDAILAHAVANLIVFATAYLTGRMHII